MSITFYLIKISPRHPRANIIKYYAIRMIEIYRIEPNGIMGSLYFATVPLPDMKT